MRGCETAKQLPTAELSFPALTEQGTSAWESLSFRPLEDLPEAGRHLVPVPTQRTCSPVSVLATKPAKAQAVGYLPSA